MKVLVTGGAGYIGSHTCVELLASGHEIVVVDNYSNSSPEAMKRVQHITGRDFPVCGIDLLDREALDNVFREHRPEAVIHFAGYKAVGESVQLPLKYYHNNITGTLILCELMAEHHVKRLIFSSSATVYGVSEQMPLTEDMPLGATNPYGRTKLMIEEILRDLIVSDPSWSISLLRYFNPVGAHESGFIGEDPNGVPNNLMPYVTQVAVGKLPQLRVFGGDYPTPDGTGVRDYIHVVDLAAGHVKALERSARTTGAEAFNLGTGRGCSVLELVHAFEAASGVRIPYAIVERRPGDAAVSYADPAKAERVLGWRAERDMRTICEDAWRWQKGNPGGYK